MPEPVDILAAAENTDPDPPRSKLDPYAEAIWALRRKRKRLRAIAAFLQEHGVQISKSTVGRWLKRHPQTNPEALAKPEVQSQPVRKPLSDREAEELARGFFLPPEPPGTRMPYEQKQRPYNIDP